jgi:P-type E1-E2 ATPase
VGDVVLVGPESRVPADGTVIDGTADVDESVITGESRTISKTMGAAVTRGGLKHAGAHHSSRRTHGSLGQGTWLNLQ